MTTLSEYKLIEAEQALERAVFTWRPDSTELNPFDTVGPATRLRLLKRGRWHFAYECYLHSAAWRRVRRDVLARAQLRCEHCGRGGLLMPLEVHHTTYVHLGDERLEELEALCGQCHADADRERRRARGWRRGWRRTA
jgi:hypothetical protein